MHEWPVGMEFSAIYIVEADNWNLWETAPNGLERLSNVVRHVLLYMYNFIDIYNMVLSIKSSGEEFSYPKLLTNSYAMFINLFLLQHVTSSVSRQ